MEALTKSSIDQLILYAYRAVHAPGISIEKWTSLCGCHVCKKIKKLLDARGE